MPDAKVTATVYLIDIVTTDEGLPKGFEPLRDTHDSRRRLRARERRVTADLQSLRSAKPAADAFKVSTRELKYDIIGAGTGVRVNGNVIDFDGTGGMRIFSSVTETRDEVSNISSPFDLLHDVYLQAKRSINLNFHELFEKIAAELPDWRPAQLIADLVKRFDAPDQQTSQVILDKDIPSLHFKSTVLFANKPVSGCALRPSDILPDTEMEDTARLLPVFWYPFKCEAFVAGLVAQPAGYFAFGRLGAPSSGYFASRKRTPWVGNTARADLRIGRHSVLDEQGNPKYQPTVEIERRVDGRPDRDLINVDESNPIEAYESDIPFFLGAMPGKDPTKVTVKELRETDGTGFCFMTGQISCPENHETTFDPIVNCGGCD